METKYHIEITKRALIHHFSIDALDTIIKANIKQDRLLYLIGHDYIHFDGNAFSEGFQYIASQEMKVIDHLEHSDFEQARVAFGCILHSWQDFYSHSNYVQLWLRENTNIPPESIIHADPEILQHPELRSGKNYGLIEIFALIPLLSKWITPSMPADSHARMNLDNPSTGEDFDYAYWGAYHATVAVHKIISQRIEVIDPSELISVRFKDLYIEN